MAVQSARTIMRRLQQLLALLAISMLALAAHAQSENEFGRASGGAIEAITKSPRQFSGSLSLSHSTGFLGGRGYDGTIGGKINDRVWFFGAASVLPTTRFSPKLTATDAKVTAQPVDWSSISASFTQLRQPLFDTTQTNVVSLPSSFLSLHSTAMLSDHAMLNFSLTRSNSR